MSGSLVLETLYFLSVNFLRKVLQSPGSLKYMSFKTLLKNISSLTKTIPRYTELYSNIINTEFHTKLAMNTKARLSPTRSRETFLAPSVDNQACSYGTNCSKIEK